MTDSRISFTPQSYCIDGEPVWLASGEMHYFKLPRGDWRRRLLQLKLAGFNAVSVYMPWNYHEVLEGEWDFTGEKDVRYFLELAAEFGLYVVARPGPFICDEWQCGGIPPWLSAKKGIRLRTADPQFLSYCDRWWDQIAAIIAEYQLDGGKGTIILTQVENEYGHLGANQEADYIYHLRDGLRQRGVTTPIINCDSFIRFARLQPRKWDGINLCCNFGGDAVRNLARARDLQSDAPLFVTEYWIAAFDWWGRPTTAAYADAPALNGALAIAAGGAGGLTAFVFSGGAHFGYWHGCSICSDQNFMTTLYGPGAPILDDGSLGGKYPLFKAGMTALMSASRELAQAGMPEVSEDHGLVRAVRRGPQAEFTFYLNHSKEEIQLADREKDQAAVDFSLPAGAVAWTVKRLPITDDFMLLETNASLFCTEPGLVLYGEPGKRVHVDIACVTGTPDIVSLQTAGFTAAMNGSHLHLEVTVPESGTLLSGTISTGQSQLPLVILAAEMISHCWQINLPDVQPVVIIGPERIEDAVREGGSARLTISARELQPCWVLSAAGIAMQTVAYTGVASPATITLQDIQMHTDFPEAAPDFADDDWFAAGNPQPMARFGTGHGRAWYRTRFTVTDVGPQTIQFSGAADRALCFVDGEFLAVRGMRTSCGWHIMPCLQPGEHTLAILVENLGMFNSGAEFDVPLGEPKGLYGPVWLNGEEITAWRMREGIRAGEALNYWPQVAEASWEPSTDTTAKGPVWLHAHFTMPQGFDGAVRLSLENAGKGSVWLNGHNLGRYWRIGPQQSLWMPLSWLQEENILVIFEETEINLAQVNVTLQSFGMQGAVEIPLSASCNA